MQTATAIPRIAFIVSPLSSFHPSLEEASSADIVDESVHHMPDVFIEQEWVTGASQMFLQPGDRLFPHLVRVDVADTRIEHTAEVLFLTVQAVMSG